jgi:hypothetical protein
MASPQPQPSRENGGVEVSGYGASLKASGRNAVIFAGFLVMAAAIIVDGMLNRTLLTEVMATQKAFIEGVINVAKADHDGLKDSVIEIKSMCLAERFSDRLRHIPTKQGGIP